MHGFFAGKHIGKLLTVAHQIAKLPAMPIRHTAVCEKDAMAEAVLDAVK